MMHSEHSSLQPYEGERDIETVKASSKKKKKEKNACDFCSLFLFRRTSIPYSYIYTSYVFSKIAWNYQLKGNYLKNYHIGVFQFGCGFSSSYCIIVIFFMNLYFMNLHFMNLHLWVKFFQFSCFIDPEDAVMCVLLYVIFK